MSKILISAIAIFLTLVSFRPTTVMAADKILFGPVELLENASFGSNSDMQITVETKNPDKKYTFETPHDGDCPRRGPFTYGPCIGVRELDASTTGNTNILIKNVVRWINGQPDTSARVFLRDGYKDTWDLRAGGQTGWVSYAWEKLIGIPTIQLSSTEITKAEKVIVVVALTKPLASNYEIRITMAGGSAAIVYIKLFCDPNKETCTILKGETKGDENLDYVSGTKLVTFELSGSNLIENQSYVVGVTSLSIPKEISDKIQKTFTVKGPVPTALKVEINPSTIQASASKNRTIQIKLVDGSTNETYKVEISSKLLANTFSCSGPGCTYNLQLGDGLSGGSYSIIVTSLSNSSIQGGAQLTVVSDQPAPTGVITQPGSGQQTPTTTTPQGPPTTAGGTPCDTADPKNPGIQTAIGCIHTSPVGFIKDFLKFILGISGGLAFLMMLLGAFQMVTSAGNPETLQTGRDRFQSAIIGLLFVIFAVLLLQIIGVGILGLGEQFGEP
ncbi:hypothetical protein HYZ05_01040 [Candidatus Daviesbacteria bacterium]|nr:hypothetical protein [Candidatus Daviesbacteria bacterium]